MPNSVHRTEPACSSVEPRNDKTTPVTSWGSSWPGEGKPRGSDPRVGEGPRVFIHEVPASKSDVCCCLAVGCRCLCSHLQVGLALVAPGEVSSLDRHRLDDGMPRRVGVGGVVPALGLAATHVTAGGAHAKIEPRAALLALIRVRSVSAAVEVWTGSGHGLSTAFEKAWFRDPWACSAPGIAGLVSGLLEEPCKPRPATCIACARVQVPPRVEVSLVPARRRAPLG